ncbi:hypothetical protein V8F20_001871, partial [Naviculisporaceae sp. PSN 640]
PPAVCCYSDLVALRDRLQGTIVVAIDLENVDHFNSTSALPKLSEVGMASYDLAYLWGWVHEGNIQEVAHAIQATHWIVDEWNWVTGPTCPAFWHRNGKPHAAKPYDFQFWSSRRAETPLKAMQEAGDLLVRKQTENAILDAWGDVEREQEVIVLFWAANLETQTMQEAQLGDLFANPHFQYWDLQQWWPIMNRWRKVLDPVERKSQASCWDFLHSLGLWNTVELHNAGNDAYAEVLGFCRFLMQTEEEFDTW